MTVEPRLRAAVFQPDTAGMTPQQRIAALAEAVRTAEADLILCPELFLSGYAAGEDLRRFAEPASGAGASAIAAIARETSTAIVYGYPERTGDRLYNAALAIGPDGAVLANHRKYLLPPGFESEFFAPHASGLTLFELGGVRFAMLICYDIEFPEPARACALAGAHVLLVPTALSSQWHVVANRLVPSRAFENGVYLLYANHAGHEGGIDYLGESCIVGPDGKDLARAGAAAGLLTAEIDPGRVAACRDRLPYLRDLPELSRLMRRP